ncbi:MAG: tRNA lysidine(34) synthetase TilS [Bacteroidetes bacterium]|nr:MAG: tRNA lysidine(34) synthetase TilS [Bacteroidota bacterium]
MIDRFLENIEKNKLFNANEKILLAVSGGMDSVVMAHLFHQAGFLFSLAHCNFQLRGEESDKDERFVEELARNFHVQCFTKSFDTLVYSDQQGISTQMAARELRYGWFEELRKTNGFSYISTGHHKDDHSETILINMVRGSGLTGLQGIRQKWGHVIRPLWDFTRKEIGQYCNEHDINFREDATNEQTKYVRNKIRHQVIPHLKEINPSFNDSMVKLSSIAEQTGELLHYLLEKEFELFVEKNDQKLRIEINRLQRLPCVSLVLYHLLNPYGFQGAVVDEIIGSLAGQPGKKFFSASHLCLRDREYLMVSPLEPKADFQQIPIDELAGEVSFAEGKLQLVLHEAFRMNQIKKEHNVAFLDADKLQFPLTLRAFKEGDYFYPFGMSGKKKLSDYFVDEKVALTDKQNKWLLCSGEDIVWVIGMRTDERYRISLPVCKVLEVKFIPHVK